MQPFIVLYSNTLNSEGGIFEVIYEGNEYLTLTYSFKITKITTKKMKTGSYSHQELSRKGYHSTWVDFKRSKIEKLRIYTLS